MLIWCMVCCCLLCSDRAACGQPCGSHHAAPLSARVLPAPAAGLNQSRCLLRIGVLQVPKWAICGTPQLPLLRLAALYYHVAGFQPQGARGMCATPLVAEHLCLDPFRACSVLPTR